MKLNKHLNAFSGAEIDKAWRDKLLGTTHPYNKSVNNEALFDSLSLNELSRLQQRTFAQANWQLFLPNNAQAEFDLKQSLTLWPTYVNKDSPSPSALINTVLAQKPPQSRTLYVIDAPGSVQTRAIHLARPTTIYCGYRFLIDWYVIGLERIACSSNL